MDKKIKQQKTNNKIQKDTQNEVFVFQNSSAPLTLPCDVGDDAFVPYWFDENGKAVFGVDKYIVKGIEGCGDIWTCHIQNDNGFEIWGLEPCVDVFFTEKEAEKKLNWIKKTENKSKILKWRRNVPVENTKKV